VWKSERGERRGEERAVGAGCLLGAALSGWGWAGAALLRRKGEVREGGELTIGWPALLVWWPP
jgi:hypothetical protein